MDPASKEAFRNRDRPERWVGVSTPFAMHACGIRTGDCLTLDVLVIACAIHFTNDDDFVQDQVGGHPKFSKKRIHHEACTMNISVTMKVKMQRMEVCILARRLASAGNLTRRAVIVTEHSMRNIFTELRHFYYIFSQHQTFMSGSG